MAIETVSLVDNLNPQPTFPYHLSETVAGPGMRYLGERTDRSRLAEQIPEIPYRAPKLQGYLSIARNEVGAVDQTSNEHTVLN